MKQTKLSRQELYDLVWSTPMIKAAADLGITGNGLAKICDRLTVPYPYRGYWAKVQAGKSPAKLKLQPAKSDTILIAEITATPPKVAKAPDPVEQAVADAGENLPEIHVLQTLSRPHHLIAALLEQKKRDRQLARRDPWRSSLIEPETELDRRVLRIKDALFKALEKRGYKIQSERGYLHAVWVTISGERIDFTLTERISQRREPLTAAELKDPDNAFRNRRWRQVREPTGELILSATSQYKWTGKGTWAEQPDRPLETQLGAVVVGFEALGKAAAEETARRREAERLRWEEQAQRAQRERLNRLDEKRWLKVRAMAADWEETERLRRFLTIVAARIDAMPTQSERAQTWLAWAQARLDAMDPLAGEVATLFDATDALNEWSV